MIHSYKKDFMKVYKNASDDFLVNIIVTSEVKLEGSKFGGMYKTDVLTQRGFLEYQCAKEVIRDRLTQDL